MSSLLFQIVIQASLLPPACVVVGAHLAMHTSAIPYLVAAVACLETYSARGQMTTPGPNVTRTIS